ncbi:MAG: hypothetical protein WAV95_18835 [Azonexus sp.]
MSIQSAREEASTKLFRRFDLALAALLALLVFLGFNANMRSIVAADTFAARYLPFSILRNHTVVLDPIVATVAQGRRTPTVQGKVDTAFWILKGREDHFVSRYPVTVPLLITPLYLPAIVYLDRKGWDPLLFDRVARIMEKLSASLIATASAVLLYFLLRRRSSPRNAALLTLVYAFGTTTWCISSQALWQHGLAQLFIVATMLLLTGTRSTARVAAVGFLCALIAVTRPPDAILAAGLGLYGLWWAGRKIPVLVLSALVPVGLTLAYNLLVVGHIAGAYALAVRSGNFSDGFLEGLAGLLFSPTRGLFVFSPFLLFVPCFIGLALRDRNTRGLTVAVSLAVIVQVIFYAMIDWRQGISFGPRWLTDMLPLLMWMLPPILTGLSRPARAAFSIACAIAIAIQGVGAFWYTGSSDTALMIASAQAKDRTAPFWDFRRAAFVAELQHRRAPADLLTEVRGSIDVIRKIDSVAGSPAEGGAIERLVEISGWALADGRTPTDVAASIDGREIAGTGQFFSRPDVAKALGIEHPAGWTIAFPADRLAAGQHVLTILVRTKEGSLPRVLGERSFTLETDSDANGLDRQLKDAARRAAQVLVERQQAPGYWLTAYTSGLRFEQPRPEMNTFFNAIMLDIAGPVAKEAGLEETLGRARNFLKKQIEPGGLVRYHGQPNAPTIGVLGCAITPDTDDTALVWRVAPGENRQQLRAALSTINSFRRPDGLYQTWLAPQKRYECIDPGHDPNPADIGIQMNLFLLLAQEDPPAAQALCRSMARKSGADDIWVYYSQAPLMVALRQADLRAAGCRLQFPPSALKSSVPGQDVWIELTQILQRANTLVATPESLAEKAMLLRKIAASEFAFLNTAPPLLYHNDMTASVKRFYWSPEIGYALWLRLYYAYEGELLRSGLPCPSSGANRQCGGK